MHIVVNRHHYKGKELPSPWVYVGRGTPLGNPFTLREHGLAALEMYRRHLWAKICDRDPAVLGALRSITPAHSLVCSCAPRPCHADVIAKAWSWLRSSEGGQTCP